MTDDIEKLVNKLEFYVVERQLNLIELVAKEFENHDSSSPFKQSGYMILSVATSYFEMIAQFLEGVSSEGQSKKFFEKGFVSVYPDPSWTTESIKKIYQVVRNGMYHGGMPKAGCHLSRFFDPGFHLCGQEVHINPAAIVREIKAHFVRYMTELRNPANKMVREKFRSMCLEMGLDETPPNYTDCVTPRGAKPSTTTPAPWATGDGPKTPRVETEPGK